MACWSTWCQTVHKRTIQHKEKPKGQAKEDSEGFGYGFVRPEAISHEQWPGCHLIFYLLSYLVVISVGGTETAVEAGKTSFA